MIKYRLVTALSGFLLTCLFLSCRQRQPAFTPPQMQKDSARLHAYFDSVYDLQFEFPDSAFMLWQPAAEEAKLKKIYKPLFSYYKYAVYNRLVLVHDPAVAERLTTEATQLAKHTGDSLHIGIASFCMGMLYAYKEVADSASYHFMMAAENLEGGKDWGTLLDAYSNLAEMMLLQGDYRNAEKYLLYIQDVTRMRKEWRELAQGFSTLYEVEAELGRTALAKNYLDSATIYYKKINEPANPHLQKTKGQHEFKYGTTASAKQNFSNAFTGFLQIGDSLNAGISLLSKAMVYAKENQSDSVLNTIKSISNYTNPTKLPRTALKHYYELQLSLPGRNTSAYNRDSISARYVSLVNSMLEANKKMIGTEYLHQMEQEAKNKLILQTTLKNVKRGKTITLLVISAAFLLIMLLLTWLYWRKKQQLEQEKTNLMRHEKNLEVWQMRMNTQLEERSRISQELHDELGATLTSISLAAELLKKKYLLEDSKEANMISHLSSDMVDKMNDIVWSLNTGNDNLQSLIAYIRKFAGSFLTDSDIKLCFVETQPLPEMPMQGFIRRSLYLTVKEALNNIVKHAGATEVVLQISFQQQEQALQIVIQDNGVGMEQAKENKWGNGLRNMKNHLKTVGGIIEWTNNKGTQINILSPIS